MPLIRRVIVKADVFDSAVIDALADVELLAERLGVGSGSDLVLPDAREADAVKDFALARLRRFVIASAAKVTQHNCPHVTGSEEVTWGPCTDPAYAYTEEAV